MTKKYIIAWWIILSGHFFIYAQSQHECDSLIQKSIDNIWKQNFIEAFNELFKVRNLAQNKGWYEINYRATNNIGVAYTQLNDKENAIKYFLESYELCLKNHYEKGEMSPLNNIAIIYSKDKDYKNAIKYFEMALMTAKKFNIKSRIGYYLCNLANVYYDSQDYDKAMQYYLEAKEYTTQAGESEMRVLADAENIYINLLIKNKKFKEAKNASLSILSRLKETSYETEKTELSLSTARCYVELFQYDSAWVYINNGLANCIDPNIKIQFFNLAFNINHKLHNYERAYIFKDSIYSLQNNIFLSEQKLDMEKYKVKFELANTRKQLELSNQKSTLQKQVYGLSIIILLSSASILLLFFYNKAKNAQKSKELAERNIKIAQLELENNTSALRIRDSEIREKEHQLEISRLQTEKEKQEALLLEQQLLEKEIRNQLKIKEAKEKEIEALLEQEKLKVEIELRNKLLLDKIAFQESRNETIKSLIGGIELEMKGSSSIKKITDKLKSELEKEAEWDSFLLQSNNISMKILETIKTKHPSLSAKDLRFIYYIYQKLDTKEIAELLNITSEGCRKRKERIGKKLNLEPHQHLFDYILTFDV